MSRITFRKQPRYDGLARLAESYHANRDGKKIARIQRASDQNWFWYGGDYNSLEHGPTKSIEECKDEVRTYFKK